jgi:hypothetical protein
MEKSLQRMEISTWWEDLGTRLRTRTEGEFDELESGPAWI